MESIFEQIANAIAVDEEKDFVNVTFSNVGGSKLSYNFKLEHGRIIIKHKSHAPIAAITGKTILYKSEEIRAKNDLFKWLDIKFKVNYEYKKSKDMAELKDGIISFFPTD